MKTESSVQSLSYRSRTRICSQDSVKQDRPALTSSLILQCCALSPRFYHSFLSTKPQSNAISSPTMSKIEPNLYPKIPVLIYCKTLTKFTALDILNGKGEPPQRYNF